MGKKVLEVFATRPSVGLASFVSYSRLQKECIENAINLSSNERIIGVFPEQYGLTIYLEYIKSRNLRDKKSKKNSR